MAIRALTVDDHEVYRAIRLRALRTDPDAFASTFSREDAFDRATWQARLAGFQGRPGQVFVDADLRADGGNGDNTVGIVGVGVSENPSDSMLWGMWTDPAARGMGVGRRLVDATIGWARSQQCTTMTLWVMQPNDAARQLYERCGFVAHTPGPDDHAPDGCHDEICMRCHLVPGTR